MNGGGGGGGACAIKVVNETLRGMDLDVAGAEAPGAVDGAAVSVAAMRAVGAILPRSVVMLGDEGAAERIAPVLDAGCCGGFSFCARSAKSGSTL